jgi:hypothetical protein
MFLLKLKPLDPSVVENALIAVGTLVVSVKAPLVIVLLVKACWLNVTGVPIVGALALKAKFVPAPVVTVAYILNVVLAVVALGSVISID